MPPVSSKEFVFLVAYEARYVIFGCFVPIQPIVKGIHNLQDLGSPIFEASAPQSDSLSSKLRKTSSELFTLNSIITCMFYISEKKHYPSMQTTLSLHLLNMTLRLSVHKQNTTTKHYASKDSNTKK